MKTATVYRLYNARGELLYVGVTTDVKGRMHDHAEKWWWPLVHSKRFQEFPTEREAYAAEAVAINAESPLLNVNGRVGDVTVVRQRSNAMRAGQAALTGRVTLAEAADYLGVSTKTIRRYIASGTLTGYRVGGRLIRLDPVELEKLLRPIPNAKSVRV